MKAVKDHIENHFKKFSDEAMVWLQNIAREMNQEDRLDIAQQALKGVLHALRDRMTPEEVFDLSSQLPVLIRGFYLEGYKPANKPIKYSAEDLLYEIEKSFGGNTSIVPEVAFRGVLRVLYNRGDTKELQQIHETMPKDIKQLWKKSLKHEHLHTETKR